MAYRQGNRATNASCSMVPGLSMGRFTTNAVVETKPDAKPDAMAAYSTAAQQYAIEAVVKDATID